MSRMDAVGVGPAAIALPPTVSVDLTALVEARLPAGAVPSGARREL